MTHKRSQLHRMEERLKHILRDQVAEFASLLEVIISVLVLTGLVISSVPVAREMLSLWQSGSTDAFQTFLGHAFNLVIGIEFIKMLAKHSPGSALEVLLYAIARNMILGHGTAAENLLGVAAIGLIFVIRKFLFVPSFGATLPGGEPAQDLAHLFHRMAARTLSALNFPVCVPSIRTCRLDGTFLTVCPAPHPGRGFCWNVQNLMQCLYKFIIDKT